MRPIKSGLTDLTAILAQLEPVRRPGEYVYATLPYSNVIPRQFTCMEMIEEEGITAIVEAPIAQKYGLDSRERFAWITLKVPSSLFSVGLTAVFSNALAEAQIPCNVVAGFHHDHLFVPVKESSRALEVLHQLQAEG